MRHYRNTSAYRNLCIFNIKMNNKAIIRKRHTDNAMQWKMYWLCILFLCTRVHGVPKDSESDDITNLVTSLRNDANLDLSEDEEYEDLRAELLAYHSALSSLASSRREHLYFMFTYQSTTWNKRFRLN